MLDSGFEQQLQIMKTIKELNIISARQKAIAKEEVDKRQLELRLDIPDDMNKVENFLDDVEQFMKQRTGVVPDDVSEHYSATQGAIGPSTRSRIEFPQQETNAPPLTTRTDTILDHPTTTRQVTAAAASVSRDMRPKICQTATYNTTQSQYTPYAYGDDHQTAARQVQ